MTDRNHKRRREFILLLVSAPAAWPLGARAQQARKVYRLGFLTAGAPISGVTGFGTPSRSWAGSKTNRCTCGEGGGYRPRRDHRASRLQAPPPNAAT